MLQNKERFPTKGLLAFLARWEIAHHPISVKWLERVEHNITHDLLDRPVSEKFNYLKASTSSHDLEVEDTFHDPETEGVTEGSYYLPLVFFQTYLSMAELKAYLISR
jgi:hypothetical protein